jgi:hypothetical protein
MKNLKLCSIFILISFLFIHLSYSFLFLSYCLFYALPLINYESETGSIYYLCYTYPLFLFFTLFQIIYYRRK